MSNPRSAFTPAPGWMERLASYTATSDQTSVVLPIDGESYDMIVVKMRAVNNTTGGAIYQVRPNGISTGYGYERIYGNGTLPTSNSSSTYNGFLLAGARAGEIGYGSCTFDPRSGVERFAESNYTYGITGTSMIYSFWQHSIWNDSTTIITSLEIISTAVGGLSTGSMINIYGVKV